MVDSSVWMNLCSLSLTQVQVLSVQCTWLCNTLKTEKNDTPDEKNGKKKKVKLSVISHEDLE